MIQFDRHSTIIAIRVDWNLEQSLWVTHKLVHISLTSHLLHYALLIIISEQYNKMIGSLKAIVN